MASKRKLGGLGYPSLIDVHAHARNTSDMGRTSQPSQVGTDRWRLIVVAVPERLTAAELDAYREGRNAALSAWAAATGRRVALVDL